MQEESGKQNRFHVFDQHKTWVRCVLPTLDFVIPALPLKQQMCHLAVQWKYCSNNAGFESCSVVICLQDKITFLDVGGFVQRPVSIFDQ